MKNRRKYKFYVCSVIRSIKQLKSALSSFRIPWASRNAEGGGGPTAIQRSERETSNWFESRSETQTGGVVFFKFNCHKIP